MEELNLAEYLDQNPGRINIKDKSFIIDKEVVAVEGYAENKFFNCKFKIQQGGKVIFKNAEWLNSCEFIGEFDYSNKTIKANLSFVDCTQLFSCKIKGVFNEIYFSNCKVNLLEDNSFSENFQFTNTKAYDSKFKGDCDRLLIRDAVIESTKSFGLFSFGFKYNFISLLLTWGQKKIGMYSEWNKKIKISAICKNTTYDNVLLNPFYFATKCSDKSTLDISSAKLTDDWSRLRKKYSGVSLFVVFLLTFFYFLPFLTKSFVLLLASKLDSAYTGWERTELWKAVLFEGQNNLIFQILFVILTVVLVTYNLGRLWITISIARLKEEEKFMIDSHFQLVSIHPEKLSKQIFIDKILNTLFIVSIIYSIIKLFQTLMIEVPMF